MKHDDPATLLDIEHAGSLIVSFVEGATRDQLESDMKLQSAVLHQTLVLGEAVKRLSAAFRKQHPVIPWQKIAGMRDRLIHAYEDVDLDLVWSVATSDVPDLLEKLRPLFPRENA